MAVLQGLLFVVFLTLLAAAQARVLTRVEIMEQLMLRNDSVMAKRKAAAVRRIQQDVESMGPPEETVAKFEMSIRNHTASRRKLRHSYKTKNIIDHCLSQYKWEMNPKALAHCVIGFGKKTLGGYYGKIYVVTDPRDDDAVNPRPGTLRHAVIQTEPLWIVFEYSMVIRPKEEMIVNSYKTIDGRGNHVVFGLGGACVTIQYVQYVIIHGIHFVKCKPAGNAMVRNSPSHYGWRTISDGDGVSIFGSSNIWIDHCSLSDCADGLIDAIMGSSLITISNNHFANHNEVILLGHSDSYTEDKNMFVTIAFNHFGKGLVQRMPRCRHGFFHVVNNDYTHWEKYAIGGSANPSINSQGNRFVAPDYMFSKSVTKVLGNVRASDWQSQLDSFENGAVFGLNGVVPTSNAQTASDLVGVVPGHMVGKLTSYVGPLSCGKGYHCP